MAGTVPRYRPAAAARQPSTVAPRRLDLLGYALLLPTLIVLAVVVVYPLLQALYMSLQRYRLTDSAPPAFVGLANYAALARDPVFWGSLQTTVVWTVANLVAQMVLGTALALLLNEPLRARGAHRAVALIPWIVPSVAAALIWRWMYDGSAGLINALLYRAGLIQQYVAWLGNAQTALPAVVVESIWKGTPFVVVIVLAALQAIPGELYEAASIDGAGRGQRFWNVTLPAISPTLAIAAVLTVIYTVNNFNAIWLMTQGGPLHATEILFTYAYKTAFQRFDFGSAAAMSVVLFGILLVASAGYIFLVERNDEQ
ncbi:MAG: sugar ABC transporter permease [Chloroflexi bacterium]|nr:sugar ABC transporter permease [Chloroflexota bacterium]